jgi:hypothetical protein
LEEGTRPHPGYDDVLEEGDSFSAKQVFRYWSEILERGIHPRDVVLIGFGGGELSALEYRVALGLGATAGLVAGTGGAADAVLGDPVWAMPGLLPLVADPMTLRAFIAPKAGTLKPDLLEAAAREFHARYVSGNTTALPDILKPWEALPETFRRANLDEAAGATQILETAGFSVRGAECAHPASPPVFTAGEIERMAEMEHGRWVVERLRDGWRLGKKRDDALKRHPCLVAWADLPECFREYDRQAVAAFSSILARAGLAICRRE